MPTYELRWERGPKPDPMRDAYAVDLGVDRDGERLGLWMGIVSGPAISGTVGKADDRFWSALAVATARQVQAEIESDPPSRYRQEAYELFPEPQLVNELAVSDEQLPPGPSVYPILRFEA